MRSRHCCFGIASLLLIGGCLDERREVTATAYNSTRAQTDDRPHETACGTRLEPGRKVIAVSRDLKREGLDCGTAVRIDGLQGTWTVEDVTAARHRMQIDIYMGQDVGQAREWGARKVEIRWRNDCRQAGRRDAACRRDPKGE